MRLVRCDRCPTVTQASEAHSLLRVFDVHRDVVELDVLPAQGRAFDLCAACRADLERFLTPITVRTNTRPVTA